MSCCDKCSPALSTQTQINTLVLSSLEHLHLLTRDLCSVTLRLAQLEDFEKKDQVDRLQGPARDFYDRGSVAFQKTILTYLAISTGKINHAPTRTDKGILLLNSLLGMGSYLGGPVATLTKVMQGAGTPALQNTIGGGSVSHRKEVQKTMGLDSLPTITRTLFLRLVKELSIAHNPNLSVSNQSWQTFGENLAHIAYHYITEGRLSEYGKQIQSDSEVKKEQKVGDYLASQVLKFLKDPNERKTLSSDLRNSKPVKEALEFIKEHKLDFSNITPAEKELRTSTDIGKAISKNPYILVQAATDQPTFLAPFDSFGKTRGRLYRRPYYLKIEAVPESVDEFYIRDSEGKYLYAKDNSSIKFISGDKSRVKFNGSANTPLTINVLSNKGSWGTLAQKWEWFGTHGLKLIKINSDNEKKIGLEFKALTPNNETH